MEQFLEKLFESVAKVRLLRLFMQNPEQSFTAREIATRTRSKMIPMKRELLKLVKLHLLLEDNRRVCRATENPSLGSASARRRTSAGKSVRSYSVNRDFTFLEELRALVIQSSAIPHKKLLSGIRGLGKIHLAVLCGVFVNSEHARTDLLIVGERIKRKFLQHFLSELESELGKSIKYTLMDLKEFRYRLDMYDRFLRDILEYPHEKLINRLHL